MSFQGVPVQTGNTVGDGSGTPTNLLTDADGRLLSSTIPGDGANTIRVATAAVLAAASGANAQLVTPPGAWQVNHAPAAATKATATKAAGGSGVRHVITGIYATLACDANAQTPLGVSLVEDAAGTPVTLWSGVLAAPANGAGVIALSGLNLVQPTADRTLTLSFSAAGVSLSLEAVTLTGFDIS